MSPSCRSRALSCPGGAVPQLSRWRGPMSNLRCRGGAVKCPTANTARHILRRNPSDDMTICRLTVCNKVRGSNMYTSPKPQSESPLQPQLRAARLKVEREKGTVTTMGRWNGDTGNQHTNKQQQWCAAATCTNFQNPHQNHPFSQLRAARLKVE